MKAQFDGPTRRWLSAHPLQETTVARCKVCGLFYKPTLGHNCSGRNRTAPDGGGQSRTDDLSVEVQSRSGG